MKLSIAVKFSLFSVFLVLASAAVVGGIFHNKITDTLVDLALEKIAIETLEASTSLQQIMNNHDEDVLFLANTPPIQSIIQMRTDDRINEKYTSLYSQQIERLGRIFESLLEKKNDYLIARFIDEHGHELVSVRRGGGSILHVKPERLQNKAHRPYVRETLKLSSGKIYLSEINLNREFGEIVKPYEEVLRIATPVYDEKNNKIKGLIVLTVDMGKELRAIQRHIKKTSEGVIYITNDRGSYLLHPEKDKTYGFDLDKRFRIQEDVPQLAEQFLPSNLTKQLLLMPEKTDGINVVNFIKIPFDLDKPERFIGVIMTRNFSDIVTGESKVFNEAALWALFMVLLGTGLAVLFSIHITRPIQQMIKAVNEFRHNQIATVTMPVTQKDEIGVLARAFNSMIQQVELSQSRLEDMNKNLETRVEARTIDLNQSRLVAERANKAKSEFLSRMSHELRTPLNAILGFGQMLELDDKSLNDIQSGNVQEILEAGNHLLSLINDVLDLAKIESGQVEMHMQDVNVSDVLHQSINLIKPQAETRRLEIVDNISAKGYIAYADDTRLKQVLVNLLTNAVKYNSLNGRIDLDSEVLDHQTLRISISDSGNGLSEEDINKLFIPFERLDTVNNVEGTGIGLVITKHLIENMGGSIGVDSKQSKGSTFWIQLALSHDH